MASESVSGRSTSPTTSSTSPRQGLPCSREASRARHRTRAPVWSNLGTSRPPIYPVAPVTSTGRLSPLAAKRSSAQRGEKLGEEFRRRSPHSKYTFAFHLLTERRTVNGERRTVNGKYGT